MTQEELDEQCARWGHADRKVSHCQNPLCPGRSAAELVALDAVPDVTDELEQVSDDAPKGASPA